MIMRKVLILDDRVERKKTHMSDDAIRVLFDCVKQGFLTITTGEELENDSLLDFLANYDLFAIHRSWLVSKKLMQEVIEYVKKERKYFILFSGGISQSLLMNNYTYSSVNSAVFYTNRLPLFVEKFATKEIDQPLLEFLYGKAWLIPIYMKYRQLIWRGVDESDDEFMLFESNYGSYIEKFRDKDLSELNKAINSEITKMNIL